MNKTQDRIAMATVLIVLAAFVPRPAGAACGSPILLDTLGEALVSNPDWCATGGAGCYDFQSGPPVSPAITGVFWALGTGDPVVGAGDDNGAFSGGLQPGDSWIKQVSEVFNDLYHYPAFLTLKGGDFGFQSGNPVNWSLPVDGCVENAGPDPCTCVLLSDDWNNIGYFALLGSKRSPNFDLSTGGDIVLAPIPVATVVGATRTPGTEDALLDVRAAPATGGDYVKDGCACESGFRVFGQLVPLGAAPPTDRSTGWFPLTNVDGTPQGPTPVGGVATVLADCDPQRDEDLYLAIVVTGDSGFETPVVSGNSGRVACSQIFAVPGRPDRGRHRDPRPDRGRDGDRRDRR